MREIAPKLITSFMAGLVPAIYVLIAANRKDMDARDKPGMTK